MSRVAVTDGAEARRTRGRLLGAEVGREARMALRTRTPELLFTVAVKKDLSPERDTPLNSQFGVLEGYEDKMGC